VNRKNFIPLVGIAFAVAVVSTWIFYGLVAGSNQQSAQATARTVVVAKHSLAPGATLGADDLKSITWNGPGAPDDAFASPAQAIGGHLVTKVGENEPLLRPAVELSEGGRVTSVVPMGKRAVSLRVSDSQGLMPLLSHGSFVDIQAVQTTRDGVVSLKTVLERIPVIHVEKPGEHGIAKNEAAVVTVLVEARHAEALALSDSASKIRLTVRNPGDEGQSGDAAPARATAEPAEKPVTNGAATAPVWFTVSLHSQSPGGEPGIAVGAEPAGKAQATWTTVSREGRSAVIDKNLDGYRVHVRLQPMESATGQFRARVEPEISWPGEVTEARRLSQTVTWTAGDRILVRGLKRPDGTPALLVIAAGPAAEK
jgi:pilus assembly protein CpaB